MAIFETPKTVAQKVMKRTKSTVEVNGMSKLPEEPVLFVANHQGLFDILLLLGYIDKPLGFIAKKEIKKLPIIASWMEQLKCVFIDRSNRRTALKVIEDGVESLQAGQSMVIFPEGTRSRGRTIQPFKSGSFRLATKANVPIVPLAIDGTYKILEQNEGKVQAAHVYLEVCDPIYPAQFHQMKPSEIAHFVQTRIEKVMNQRQQAS